jgi:hypothetical protein
MVVAQYENPFPAEIRCNESLCLLHPQIFRIRSIVILLKLSGGLPLNPKIKNQPQYEPV